MKTACRHWIAISAGRLDEIDKADLVIADFTLSARNVYFKPGFARGRGKHIIQTARQGTALEFDVRNWGTVFYRNATELEEALIGAFTALKDIGEAEGARGVP